MRWTPVLVGLACALSACASSSSSSSATLRHRCPHSDRARLANHGSGLDTWLVPPGAGAVQLCRYRGLNVPGRQGTLATSRRIGSGGTLDYVTTTLNALPRPPRGAINCPSDEGSRMLAIFLYPHRPPVTVRIFLGGCPTATNGVATRWATTDTGLRLVTALERLTRR